VRVLLALLALQFAASNQPKPNCGDPIPSTPLAGTFERVPLADHCESVDSIGFGFALGSIGPAPIFAVQTQGAQRCNDSIATVRDDRIVVLAQTTGDAWGLWGRRVAASADGAFWFATASRYVKIVPSRPPEYRATSGDGYMPASVGVDAAGRVFGLERHDNGSKDDGLRLADLDTGTWQQLSPNGYAEDFIHGEDGNLYFKLFSNWRCHVYEVVPGRKPLLRAACLWQNGQVAIDPTGAVWAPSFLGVERTNADSSTKFVGPILPIPCEVSNSAALEAHVPIALPDGSVWFLYRKLWRVRADGEVSNIALPTDLRAPSAMIGTSDGSLWITSTNSGTNAPSFYRFKPS
jgi:hypothetical protein